MEADGLVQRQSDADDGRASVISITERGQAHLAERHRYIAERFSEVLGDWTDQDVERTMTVLQQLNNRLDQLTEELARIEPTVRKT